MFDFDVLDSDLKKCNLDRALGNDTVVLCHSVYPYGELPYFNYLGGLDCRTVMVSSTHSPLIHMVPLTHGVRMDTYNDPDLSLMSALKQRWALDMDETRLAKRLRVQILVHNGEVMGEWRQPLSDQWNDFLSDKRFTQRLYKQFGFHGLEWMKKQDKDNHWIWDSEVPVWEYAEMGNPAFDLFFKYYRLMPNEDLENRIKQLKG